MQIFITGGTGVVGSAAIHSLLQGSSASSHTIRALARSPTAAEKLSRAGATPILGDIGDLALLEREGAQADAVIYCAFDHAGDWGEQGKKEVAAVETLCKALSASPSAAMGRKKVLMFCTTVSGFSGPTTATEETPSPQHPRIGVNRVVEQYSGASPPSGTGIRGVQIRLAMLVHHPDKIHQFIRMLHKGDRLIYFKDGANQWPAAASSDVGDLIASALEHQDKIKEGRVTSLHAWSEWIATKDIAGAVSDNAGLPTKSIGEEELEGMDPLSKRLIGANPNIDNTWTKDTFGWTPKGNTLVQDMKEGGWFKAGGLK